MKELEKPQLLILVLILFLIYNSNISYLPGIVWNILPILNNSIPTTNLEHRAINIYLCQMKNMSLFHLHF